MTYCAYIHSSSGLQRTSDNFALESIGELSTDGNAGRVLLPFDVIVLIL